MRIVVVMEVGMMVMIKMVIKMINFYESLISVVYCKRAGCSCCGQTLWCVPVSVIEVLYHLRFEMAIVGNPFGVYQ